MNTNSQARKINAVPMGQPSARTKPLVGVASLCALVIAMAFGPSMTWAQSAPASTPMATAAPAVKSDTQPVTSPTAAAATQVAFDKLLGRWLRPDGGYVLEFRDVNASGTLAAAYYNPRPIRVAKAQTSRDEAKLKVFVELRDVNYPGSTYNLVYQPAGDKLEGIYFQAALNEQYDIYFERMK
jgi:hypothetical protein